MDRYRIERELGRGGSGIVYRAIDRRDGRAVALKVLSDEQREARLSARLEHPGIARVIDVGPGYLAMELVEGESLRARLARGPIERATAVRWLVELGEALGAAHAAGVVHLDVKPGNVLVAADDRVVVVDFGIARAVVRGDAVVPSRVAGTPRYMAPEQIAGEPVDARTDQYAWALVAYELLAGVHPRELRRDVGDADFALHERPPLLDDVAEVSPELAAVIARALAKRPEARYAKMAELLAAFAIAVDRPAATRLEPRRDLATVASRAAAPVVRAPVAAVAVPRRRRTWLVPLAAAVAIAGTVVALAGRRDPAPPSPPPSLPVYAPPLAPIGLPDEATQARRERCAVDTDCRPSESCLDGACARGAWAPPFDERFAEKPLLDRCPVDLRTCGEACIHGAATCGPRMACDAQRAVVDGVVVWSPGTCRACPSGHIWIERAGSCARPCVDDRDCPLTATCTATHGPRACGR